MSDENESLTTNNHSTGRSAQPSRALCRWSSSCAVLVR